MYPTPSDPQIAQKLVRHKEYSSLRRHDNELLEDELAGSYLRLQPYQIFPSIYMKPGSGNHSIHLGHSTGSGKTASMLNIAKPYVKMFAEKAATLRSMNPQISSDELDSLVPSIFILGFAGTKKAFYRDLLNYPTFGIVTDKEKSDLQQLYSFYIANPTNETYQTYNSYAGAIRRRVTDKTKGGFYKLYGYDEFASSLFSEASLVSIEKEVRANMKKWHAEILRAISNNRDHDRDLDDDAADGDDDTITDDVDSGVGAKTPGGVGAKTPGGVGAKTPGGVGAKTPILDEDEDELEVDEAVIADLISTGRISPRPKTLEEHVSDKIATGEIVVNRKLVELFRMGSVLMCDEIHLVYNRVMKNNRGIAIQYLKNIIENFILITASGTPFNSPGEIKDFINLHADTENMLEKTDIFMSDAAKIMRPGAPEKIAKAMRGKYSFIQDSDEKAYPKLRFHGDELIVPKSDREIPKNIDPEQLVVEGSIYPYYRFTFAPMTELHENTLDEIVPDWRIWDRSVVSPNNYALYDMVYPGASTQSGLCRHFDAINQIHSAPQKWRNEVGIELGRSRDTGKTTITGTFLRSAMFDDDAELINFRGVEIYRSAKRPSSLEVYSMKQTLELYRLVEILRRAKGHTAESEKTMIFHERVKSVGGVMHYAEVFAMNGIIGIDMVPVSTTLCCLCGYMLSEHKESKIAVDKYTIKTKRDGYIDSVIPHQFVPARFTIVHSDIDPATIDARMNHYNSAENTYGHLCIFFLGSKIIHESFDFKAVQNLLVLSQSVEINTQLFGRVRRRGSHLQLALEHRKVDIYMFMTTSELITSTGITGDDATPQPKNITPEMRRYIIKMEEYKLVQIFGRILNQNAVDSIINYDRIGLKPVESMGALYYPPPDEDNIDIDDDGDIATATFNVFGYAEQEVSTIFYVIKRLFCLHSTAYTFDDLWEFVRKPPFPVEVDPTQFAKSSFIVALDRLVTGLPEIIDTTSMLGNQSARALVGTVFDPNSTIIWRQDGVGSYTRHVVKHIGEFYILCQLVPMPYTSIGTIQDIAENLRDKEQIILNNRTPENMVIADGFSFANHISGYSLASNRKLINLSDYIAGIGQNSEYATFANELKSQVQSGEGEFAFLLNFPRSFQHKYIESQIELACAPKSRSKSGSKSIIVDTNATVINMLMGLKIIVTTAEVSKYKNAAASADIEFVRYGTEMPKKYVDQPRGYLIGDAIKIYNAEKNTWFSMSKTSMNRSVNYAENDVAICILDYVQVGNTEEVRSKLRPPKIELDVDVDQRTQERGIVCDTKYKDDLVDIAARLKIRDVNSSWKVHNICAAITVRLLSLESHERSTHKIGGLKYVYGWW